MATSIIQVKIHSRHYKYVIATFPDVRNVIWRISNPLKPQNNSFSFEHAERLIL